MRVAAARHQAEAELLQGLLLEEGIPSLMRRTGGFDVPDFLAAGPRDILVPASGEAAARDLLGHDAGALGRDRRPRRAAPGGAVGAGAGRRARGAAAGEHRRRGHGRGVLSLGGNPAGKGVRVPSAAFTVSRDEKCLI